LRSEDKTRLYLYYSIHKNTEKAQIEGRAIDCTSVNLAKCLVLSIMSLLFT